jgi:hypothetical protein
VEVLEVLFELVDDRAAHGEKAAMLLERRDRHDRMPTILEVGIR